MTPNLLGSHRLLLLWLRTRLAQGILAALAGVHLRIHMPHIQHDTVSVPETVSSTDCLQSTFSQILRPVVRRDIRARTGKEVAVRPPRVVTVTPVEAALSEDGA